MLPDISADSDLDVAQQVESKEKNPQETHQFGLYLQGMLRQPLLMQAGLSFQLAAWRMTCSAAAASANMLGKPGVSPCSNT